MGFVTQLAAGKARPGLVPGVLGPVENAAGGQLGAKTAIKIRGHGLVSTSAPFLGSAQVGTR